MTNPSHILITSVKSEGPYLLEFIAHHRVIGFDMHHFASNDCSDGTDKLLEVLASHKIITHTPNPLKHGEKPQPMAYRRIRATQEIDTADWIAVLDADEFLQITVGDGRMSDLTALASPDIDLISLNALSFGTYDSPDWEPGLVTQQFTRRLPATQKRNQALKSISRGHGLFKGLHNHNPVNFQGGNRPVRVLTGSGAVEEVTETALLVKHLRNRMPDENTHQLAFYNHYPIKSLDAYCLRHDRGSGAQAVGSTEPSRYTDRYWRVFSQAVIEDDSIIARYGKALAAEMETLLALPGVAEAHQETERLYGMILGR